MNQEAQKAAVTFDMKSQQLTMSNGIIERKWAVGGGGIGCISLKNLTSGEEFIRAVRPEATLKIDGVLASVGGLNGQQDQAFLNPKWIPQLKPNPGFKFVGWESNPVAPLMPWRTLQDRRANKDSAMTAAASDGDIQLVFHFEGENQNSGISVEVSYQMYSGQPLMTKRILVSTIRSIRIDEATPEVLAVVEPESGVDHQDQWKSPNITVITDYTFAGMSLAASNKSVRWLPDPSYTTQVNYEMKTPCLLEVTYPVGPGIDVPAGEKFKSFTVIEVVHDSTDRERRSLQLRQMFRRLAPWVKENPIMLHLTSSDSKVVRTAIDQAANCGFEMIVISFWSGLDMEDVSPANLEKWKTLVDYAHSKGLFLGGYSLLASRSINPETDVIDPKTGKPGGAIFGTSPCLCSKWGLEYFDKLKTFIEKTGFDLLEHDGSYPGDVCASTQHPGHRGLEDSQWRQYQVISEFYKWCRARGVYLNVPDSYHLAGSNKTGMGYRESNWSLPRELQHIHARQNLYDGTWEKTPSMGWMMVPLVEYQGGGKEATIEPLKDHLDDYRKHLENNFGYGAQACYRGPRLYDSPETKEVVIKSVQWFKKYREILEGDVIHLRRPTGRGIDAILHVNPSGKVRGMLLVWNPTDSETTEQISIPTDNFGLAGSLSIGLANSSFKKFAITDQRLEIKVRVKPQSMNWYVIKP